jgi:Holliday junction resolvase RusA-like endonuclease
MSFGEVLSVRVYGLPVAQARAGARIFKDASGTPRVSMFDRPNCRDWKRTVVGQVLDHKPPAPIGEAPLAIELTFHLPRPQSLPKRVLHHIKKPDCSNLLRAVEDALKGVVYRDDSQLVDVVVRKRYSDAPGVEIRVVHVVEAPPQAELVGAGGRT